MNAPTAFQNFQSGIWDLESRKPNPKILVNQVVNNSTWTLVHTCPEGTYEELNKLYIYNPIAAAYTFRMAIVPPNGTAPSGTSADQPYIILQESINANYAGFDDLGIGLNPGYRVYMYSTAGAAENFNVLLNGLVVTTLS